MPPLPFEKAPAVEFDLQHQGRWQRIIEREFIYLWYYATLVFSQIFWYWVLGITIGSVISVFAKGKVLEIFEAQRSRTLGVFGILTASALGIASPLCLYGTIPVAASLGVRGMRQDWLAAFMMSSVLLNPQLILYSASLGATVLIVRIAACFLCGCTAGFLVHVFYRDKPFFRFDEFVLPENRDTHPNSVMRLFQNIVRNIRATGVYFLLGILLSALFWRYVPADAFTSLFGKDNGFGVLTAASMGVPLYACGGGTIPLLREWLHSGMGLGSAAAFMITGPATKITNLGAVKIILGTKRFVLYFAFTMLFSISAGLLVDFLL